MSNLPKPGAVLYAKDVQRLARFYEATASMAVVHSDNEFIVLESASQQLVIHGIPKDIAQSISISAPPVRRSNTAIKLILPVESISQARQKSSAHGGEVAPEQQAFQALEFHTCDGHDPEGNVVQFRENVS